MYSLINFIYLFVSISGIKSEVFDCDRLNNSITEHKEYKKNQDADFSSLKLEISFALEINNFDSFAEINITCSTSIQNVYFIHVNPKHKLILDKTLNLNGLNLGRSYNEYYFYF